MLFTLCEFETVRLGGRVMEQDAVVAEDGDLVEIRVHTHCVKEKWATRQVGGVGGR